MTLKELMAAFPATELHDADIEISDITADSREATAGFCFIAVRGALTDGHLYIQRAVDAGAAALIVEDASLVPDGDGISFAVLPDTRKWVGPLAAEFYGQPGTKLGISAITGTNGKTSTTYLAEGMFKASGISVGIIGTVNYRYAEKILPAPTTTPGPIALNRLLADMVDAGVQQVVIEASSHALDQHRIDGLPLDCAVFTNLTRDHLDYHKDMAEYAQAKKRLFTLLDMSSKTKPIAAINMDDPASATMLDGLKSTAWRLSLNTESDAEIKVLAIAEIITGTTVTVQALSETIEIHSQLVGRYNASNLLQALAIGLAAGLNPGDAAKGLATCQSIPGRLEAIPNNRGIHALVDYGHTPDALERSLTVLNGLKQAGRLIVVFGCGGDRDKGKRPIMGRIAGEKADAVVITSDNPRTEDPFEILSQIEPAVAETGMQRIDDADQAKSATKAYAVIEDRRAAIDFAAAIAKQGDILLVTGKGHEDYQIRGTVKQHFDDREETSRALGIEWNGGSK